MRNVSSTLTSITVAWNEIDCLDQNGIIITYNIRLNDEIIQFFVEERQFTITGLDPDTGYTTNVRGVNFAGAGPFLPVPLFARTNRELKN